MLNMPKLCLLLLGLLAYGSSHAADAVAMSPTMSLLKMLMGLLVVLAIMALVAWLIKRWVPGVAQQQAVARIVGGVSLGTREKLVVVEVANRWIVLGVAPGSVTGIANLEPGDSAALSASQSSVTPETVPFAAALAGWMKKKS